MSTAINSSSAEVTTAKSQTQELRFLDWLRLRSNGYLPGVVAGYLEWVRRLILFHGQGGIGCQGRLLASEILAFACFAPVAELAYP
jgi:hypothetical protein